MRPRLRADGIQSIRSRKEKQHEDQNDKLRHWPQNVGAKVSYVGTDRPVRLKAGTSIVVLMWLCSLHGV
jgi:hypothetical protein